MTIKNLRFAYPCTVREDQSGHYVVRFRDIPEALTSGETREEALAEAEDCLRSALVGYMLEGRDLPAPSPPSRGAYLVAPPTPTLLKAAVYTVARDGKVKAAALARALGTDHKEARRILEPTHATKAQRLTDAMAAMGYVTDIAFYDASKTRHVLTAPGFVKPAKTTPRKTGAARRRLATTASRR